MKISFPIVAAVAVMCAGVPTAAIAQQVRGYTGSFLVKVTRGSYDTFESFGPLIDSYDYTGQTLRLNWQVRNFYNVPSENFGAPPIVILPRLSVLSANLETEVGRFDTVVNDDPFRDDGETRFSALFRGDENGARFVASYQCNSCIDTDIEFTFVRSSSGITGAGRAYTLDEGTREFQSELFFDIIGGQVAVVPEPATWAMMISGFGLIGGAVRRRRARVAVASG